MFANISSADISSNNTTIIIGADISIDFPNFLKFGSFFCSFSFFLGLKNFSTSSIDSSEPKIIASILYMNSGNFSFFLLKYMHIIISSMIITNMFKILKKVLLNIKYVLLNKIIGMLNIMAFLS